MSYSGPCLDCVHKHLCQAMIIHEEEVPMGYREDMKRVIGHWAEAARHAVAKHLELANLLRDWRKEFRARPMDPATVPYAKLIDFVELCLACEIQHLELPALPEEVKVPQAPTPK